MTLIKGTGKVVDIKCTEVAIPEFPNLLFGTHFDGSRYFDATTYLTKTCPNQQLSVEDFFKHFDYQIKSIAKAYELPAERLVLINTEGHQLIDGCLCYPFLSYVDFQFGAYINEVIDELFAEGIVLSDTYIIKQAQKRITPQLAKTLWHYGE